MDDILLYAIKGHMYHTPNEGNMPNLNKLRRGLYTVFCSFKQNCMNSQLLTLKLIFNCLKPTYIYYIILLHHYLTNIPLIVWVPSKFFNCFSGKIHGSVTLTIFSLFWSNICICCYLSNYMKQKLSFKG